MARTDKTSLDLFKDRFPGARIEKPIDELDYNDWLEIFRIIPVAKTINEQSFIRANMPADCYAAAARWIEVATNPSKMDKLYKGRLKAQTEIDVMDVAMGDDDEAFYVALIKKNVEQLDESKNSAQEVARITQNLNIFRQELRDVRSRKPKEGSVLKKVLDAAAEKPKAKASTAGKRVARKRGSGKKA